MSIGEFLYMRLSDSVEDVMVENASRIAANVGKNVEDLIDRYNDISKYLYDLRLMITHIFISSCRIQRFLMRIVRTGLQIFSMVY